MQTDKGIVLATRLVAMLRERRILLPALAAVERVCAETITRSNRRIYKQLTDGLAEVIVDGWASCSFADRTAT